MLDRPLVFEDPVALAILPVVERDRLVPENPELDTPFSRGMRAFMAARGRYAEDQLSTAVQTVCVST